MSLGGVGHVEMIEIFFGLTSSTLQLSTTALRTYDGHSTKAEAIFPNVPIFLVGKMVLIHRELINTQINYNLLLGCSYMYAMRTVAFTVFESSCSLMMER